MSDAQNAMLLYKKITALSREEHRKLRLKPAADFAFAAQTHWLPVAGIEFFQAARFYPIVFTPGTNDTSEAISPILLVGLEAGHNDYVGSTMRWKADTSVPAFVRRYHFVFAETSDKLTVCFDAAYEGFSHTEGEALFNEDGSNGKLLDEALKFLDDFTLQMRRTRSFADELVRLQLLEKSSARIRSAAGETFNVQDFLAVSEERLAKLGDADILRLHKEGFMGWIFAHLMSLGNLPALLELHRMRKAN
jgi:hypothetical protein